jgi:hypothetical protein
MNFEKIKHGMSKHKKERATAQKELVAQLL